MLPSGNDAALTMANYFGYKLLLKDRKKWNNKKKEDNKYKILVVNERVKRFVKEMNNMASKLGMKTTVFSNPHGLPDKGNKSCS